MTRLTNSGTRVARSLQTWRASNKQHIFTHTASSPLHGKTGMTYRRTSQQAPKNGQNKQLTFPLKDLS